MPRPIVEVLQSVATIQTTVTDPTQATVIVGPNYNLLDYDPTSQDRSSTLIPEGYNPYGYGATGTINSAIALDDRGVVESSSLKVYFEDAFFEVGAASEDSIRSVFGAADTTKAQMTAALGTAATNWSNRLEHTSGTFADGNYSNGVRVGDTVQLEYKMASEFRPTDPIAADVLANFRSSDYKVTLTVAGDNGFADKEVYKFNDSISTRADRVDLYEIPDVHAVFSALVDGDLVVTDNTACTLKVIEVADATNVTELTGTLHVPSQETVITALPQDGSVSYIEVASRLRQFVPNHLVAAELASGRIESAVSGRFTVTNNSIYHENKDPDWGYSSTTKDLTFTSEVTLRDTDLPNASSLPDKAITRATLHIESRSLNISNTTSTITVSSNDFESRLGVVSSRNPLALAASIALQNSGTSSIKVLRINEDSSQGFLNALPYLNADPNVYSILPLTQDLQVINSYAVAAVNQSSPSVGKFRIVLGSAESAPLKRYWAGSRRSEYSWVASSLASGTITNALKAAGVDGTAVIVDPEGGFLSAGGPSVGDELVFSYISGEGVVGSSKFTCSVAAVRSSAELLVNLPKAVEVAANENASIVFTGSLDISEDRNSQVEDLLKTIEPLTSNSDLAKRLVMVYPGEVSVGSEAGLPGYYLTAAVGGMLAAFEPHRPKNQIALSGIADIEYSNLGYFTDEQIDQLSDGGYFVLIQEIAGGLPFCVHQVTLGYKNYAGTQEYSELSVVNNFDYISSVFKNSLQPYVGVWNVIPQAYSSIMASLDSAILSLRSRSVDRIGAPLVSGEVVSVEPSEADAGTVNVVMDVQLPKVLNKIRLEVVSQ